jgi:septum formation protein
MQIGTVPLILASTSPRRRELITLFGQAFQFVSADIDESPLDDESPTDLVGRLSRAKAEIGSLQSSDPQAIVIGSDTVVSFEGSILGKPSDSKDAVRMLKHLRNHAHIVYSGISVKRDALILTQIALTTVHMRNYSDQEISAFVATGEPQDKAAAYAIQNKGFAPVARIEGCYANVMGLPLCHLYRSLRTAELALAEPDHACQTYLDIICPVARAILSAP